MDTNSSMYRPGDCKTKIELIGAATQVQGRLAEPVEQYKDHTAGQKQQQDHGIRAWTRL